ncbi:MAG: response regulator [Schaedlerella sp.]|nr:response regulator [Lachnospiraceae bacterium]MDY4203092.1 response regulator [Schaedlerella sp.]
MTAVREDNKGITMYYTIVVADDEEEIRRSLIRKVDWDEAGFRVVGEAENGIEALELVEKLEPDLLLTDLKMPFVSGIELARQVREIRPTMQIVFLSGYDDFTYAQQAIQYNIISYMLKPISAKEVTEELKKFIKKWKRSFRSLRHMT